MTMSKFRKIVVFPFVFLVLALATSPASSATLVWDPNSDAVDGYKVYYGTSSSNLGNSVNVGKTTKYNLDQLPLTQNRQYYFRVTAYNKLGESRPSAAVAYTPDDSTPPAPPQGLVAK
jgi:hypothetical protein